MSEAYNSFQFFLTYAGDINWPSLDTLRNIVEIVAFLGVAYWFYRRRESKPRGVVENNVKCFKVGGNKHYLQVVVLLKNTGNVRFTVKPKKGMTNGVVVENVPDDTSFLYQKEGMEVKLKTIKQINIIDEVHVEPSESTKIAFDFLLPTGVKRVKIYTYINNVKFHGLYNRMRSKILKKNSYIGWSDTTIYEIQD